MDIKDFRKNLFINSQYCTYYIEKNCTVLAGIMRSIGYKYEITIPEEKISEINAVYRRFTTIMNCAVAVEILLYLYLIVFPNFLNFIKMPIIVFALLLSVIPLVALYITYISVNKLYENYLERYVGTYRKVKFQPTIYKIEPKAYEIYKKTPRYSVFVLLFMMIAFLYYAFMPIVIDSFVTAGKYKTAVAASNIYLKFIPIIPDVYAQRAYSNFMLKNYQDAIKDYKSANDYSYSTVYNYDIIGTKTYFAPFNEVIADFDKEIANQKDEKRKQYISCEKANYLLKNKHYAEALKIYNELITTYRKQNDVLFSPQEVYNNRGTAKLAIGDTLGADIDKSIAKKICPECKYELDCKLINRP